MEPIRFRCSSCNQSLRTAGEKAGRKVRCTRCQTLIAVPIPEEDGASTAPFVPRAAEETVADPLADGTRPRHAPPAMDEDSPDADESDRLEEAREPQPRKLKKRRRADAWRLTRFGLLLLIGAGGISLFSVLLGLVFHLIPLGTMQSMMVYLWVYLWAGAAISVICSLFQGAGFGLCLFAPRESGVWPFAVAALIATMLSGCLAAPLLLWWEIGVEAPNLDPAHLQKEAEKYRKNPEEQMKKLDEQMKKLNWQMQLLSLGQIVGTLLHGVFLVSVPLLLRALCRTLRLSESEANCDSLLKIGGAILAIGLVMRLLGLFLFSLLMVVGGLSALLHLAWTGMYLVLLVQIWRAMPGGGRSRKGFE
jgi:phage FluMu protein Com